ncbi:MAG: peptidoglycan-binding domain-containing protein, partial [Blastocatellia bacterium]
MPLLALFVSLCSVVAAQPPAARQGQTETEPQPVATRKRLVKPGPITAKNHREAEQRLTDLGYWTGPIDGRWDEASRHALIAFQKVEGLKRTGRLTRGDFDVLMDARKPVPLETGEAHIEVDLTRQVLFVVEGGGVI